MARSSDSPSRPAGGETPDEIVAREALRRKVAAYLAWFAAFVTALSVLVNALTTQGESPAKSTAIGINQALSLQERGLAVGAGYGDRYATLLLNHSFETVLIQVFGAITLACAAPLVLLLLRGARVRGGSVPGPFDVALIAGTTVVAVSNIVVSVARLHGFQQAKDAGLTPRAISDALSGGWLVGAQAVQLIGLIMLAVVYFVASYQSMRVGLLSRTLGFLGVAVAILFIFALDQDPFGIPRALWLALSAWVLMGRLRSGLPRAWAEGIAVPPEPRQPRQPRGAAAPVPATPAPAPVVRESAEPTPSLAQRNSGKRNRKKR